MTNCIFCKIIKGEIPSYKIYEDKFCYAFLDISCDAEGHTLVVPKNHMENILSAQTEDLTHIMSAVKKISNHYISLGYSGINVLNNNGASSGQTVNHLHFHIIPRKENDNLNLYSSLQKKDINFNLVQEKLKMF